MKLSAEFCCHPTVFAVEDSYKIVLPVKSAMLFWVEVGGKKYFDHSCGILKSESLIHTVEVPMKELNKAKKYTVTYRKIVDRKPYFPETEEEVSTVYKFRPVKRGKPIRLYHVADTHGKIDEPIAAAKKFYKEGLDLLVLNGDIASFNSGVEDICVAYQIASGITEGSCPCVFSRGNHDLRGSFAEHLAEYTPTYMGLTYYTFHLGDLWGLVLDCAEDKTDDHLEYGHTICCHDYRLLETEFLKKVVKSKKFAAKSVRYKMVISHVPFTIRNLSDNGIFDIENEIYDEWTTLLNELDPDLQLCGHLHVCKTCLPQGDKGSRHQKFPVVVGAKPNSLNNESGYSGSALLFDQGKITAHFTDNNGEIQAAEF